MFAGRFVPLLAVAVLVWASPAAWAGPYTNLVVFGDSLSDVGNVWAITSHGTPAPPYYNGRFSNGPVWVERLADTLQLPPLAPSLLSGTDCAWGGAETGGGFSHAGPPNLGWQVNAYLSAANNHADPAALYVVWAGANDFLVGLGATPQALDPTTWADNVSGAVDTLHGAGAVNFLVPNLPPLGSTPRLHADQAVIDPEVRAFNGRLSTDLLVLESSHPDIKLQTLDVYGLLSDAIAHPGSYGFLNVTDAAMTTAGANPDKYLFWDDVHPTAVAHALLAQAVPEPSTVVLLAIAAVTWIAATGYRRHCA